MARADMDAFDTDVLIYAAAATSRHPHGNRIRRLFTQAGVEDVVGVGSVLLLPEVITKPLRQGDEHDVANLAALLARLDLRPVDAHTARVATTLGAKYGLRAPDAIHLATGVLSGADRFITNNARDFGRDITEITVTYPADLAAD